MVCDQTRSVFGIDLGKIDRSRLVRALVEAGYSCAVQIEGVDDWIVGTLTETRRVTALSAYLPRGRLLVDAEGARVTSSDQATVDALTGRVRQVYSARTVAEVSAKYRARASTVTGSAGVVVTVKVGR